MPSHPNAYRQWLFWISSPVTAAGPHSILTGFPIVSKKSGAPVACYFKNNSVEYFKYDFSILHVNKKFYFLENTDFITAALN